MKILINDKESERHRYEQVFAKYGYDKNELLFYNNISDTKLFMHSQLEVEKKHVDIIVTGENAEAGFGDELMASELVRVKNFSIDSYSQRNFRISAIPVLLYTGGGSSTDNRDGFDAVVHKNSSGNHDYFLRQVEAVIRRWRAAVMNDLDVLQVSPQGFAVHRDPEAWYRYQQLMRAKADNYFTTRTEVVSREFIAAPVPLEYEWLQCTPDDIAMPFDHYNKTLRHHLKYNRKTTERTIWHSLFRQYPRILTRDIFEDFLYEQNLYEGNGADSQECDFILRTAFPEKQRTTFFEVKREDKKYYTRLGKKRPQFSYHFSGDLNQLWDYKKFAENEKNVFELIKRVGYETRRYDYVLLAGREEERLAMSTRMDEDLSDHYPGVEVKSFEAYSMDYLKYLTKFDRLYVQ